MSGFQGKAYRKHDNAALGARGAVRNPWVAQGTPVKMKRAEPAPKPAKPRVAKPAKPKTAPIAKPQMAKPSGATWQARRGAVTLNTPMRFTPETVHPAFMHARNRAELEQAWKREMVTGQDLPIADGFSHHMDVEQMRLAMSAVKYLTDALPWTRETLRRVTSHETVMGQRLYRATPPILRAAANALGSEVAPAWHLANYPDNERWIVLYNGMDARPSAVHEPAGRRPASSKGSLPWAAIPQNAAGVLAHELGHVIHDQLTDQRDNLPLAHATSEFIRQHVGVDFLRPQEQRHELTTTIKPGVDPNAAISARSREELAAFMERSPAKDAPPSVVSEYAQTNGKEAWAETFSMLIYGTPQQRSQPIAQYVAHLINQAHPGTFKMPGERATAKSTTKATAPKTAKSPTATRTRKATAKKVSATP